MNHLPWYKIRMIDSPSISRTPVHEQIVEVINHVRRHGPSVVLIIRRAVGLPPIDPYPGQIPNYDR